MIGDLKHILTLQEKTLVSDTGGGYSESWQDVALSPAVHASVMALSGGFQDTAGQLVALQRFRIVTRYRHDILPGMRLTSDTVVYRVLSATDPDGDKKRLEIVAEQGGP